MPIVYKSSDSMNSSILVFTFSTIIVTTTVLYLSPNHCGIQHIILINDLDVYEQSLDPEFCEVLVGKIDVFNDHCEPKVEIIDCG